MHMYRFSFDKNTPIGASAKQLTDAGITEDESFASELRDTGEHREDERYFRVENESPDSLEEAIEYVQGVMLHPPRRVWMGDRVCDVEAEDLAGVRKPGA